MTKLKEKFQVWQINIGKRPEASDMLMKELQNAQIDGVLIQEPLIRNGVIPGIPRGDRKSVV